MPKIDMAAAPVRRGTGYPPPYDVPCRERQRHRLGDAAGLTQFGVNLLRLPAGQWSSQRHWHFAEDEFVWVVEGEVVLVTDAGDQTLLPGDCAGFPHGDRDGHHLQNRSTATPSCSRSAPAAWPRTARTTLTSTWCCRWGRRDMSTGTGRHTEGSGRSVSRRLSI